MENEDRPRKNALLTDIKEISFNEHDTKKVLDPHHDGLVITFYVANHFVRRILIHGGSSVNIIMLETLNKMNIP